MVNLDAYNRYILSINVIQVNGRTINHFTQYNISNLLSIDSIHNITLITITYIQEWEKAVLKKKEL